MAILLNIARILETPVIWIGSRAAWLSVILMAVIVFDVTLRHWFVVGSTQLQELEWHLHGALFLLCLGWAYSRGAHVRIELLSDRWSARRRAWVELAGCTLFLLPYVTMLLIYGGDYVAISFAYEEASASPTGLTNRWIIKGVMILGVALLGLAGTARFLEAIVYLTGTAETAGKTRFAAAQRTISSRT